MQLEYLVSACTEEYSNEYTDEWNLACKRFVDVIKMLESKEEFSQDAVDNFQFAADEFCDVYCGLTGRDGMTNYFHILRGGYISYFLQKYKTCTYSLSRDGRTPTAVLRGRFTTTLKKVVGETEVASLLW